MPDLRAWRKCRDTRCNDQLKYAGATLRVAKDHANTSAIFTRARYPRARTPVKPNKHCIIFVRRRTAPRLQPPDPQREQMLASALAESLHNVNCTCLKLI